MKDQFKVIKIKDISIKDNFNPRKFFDDKEFNELVISIQSDGVLQPIIVRPKINEEGYWVIAGERRYRAVVKLGLEEIPALVKNVNEEKARLIALVENSQRSDMSAAEEAVAAREILNECSGDKNEAVRLLGWSITKLEARLLLLHASSEVLKALTERKIKLGHAELLSQLPSDFQDATVAKIVQDGYSIAELKGKLALFSLELKNAAFDKTDCNGCPHNSSLQSSLFDDHINEGQCANRDCFNKKTEEAINVTRASLSEQYSVVYLDIERGLKSYKVVCESGTEAVGSIQLEQGCRQCGEFGAVLSTSPDSPGRVTENCCFNLDCHTIKVTEYKKATTSVSSNTNINNDVAVVTQPVMLDKLAAGVSDQETDGFNNASAATIPAKVIEEIENFYRNLAAKEVANNQLSRLIINTYGLYQLVKRSVPIEKMPNFFKEITTSGGEIDNFVKVLSSFGFDETLAFNESLLAHLLGEHEKSSPILNGMWAKGAVSVLELTKPKLNEHFILDRNFLNSFRKTGIEGVLNEAVNADNVRFVEYYENLSEKHSFKALMKKKNVEIMAEVFGCGYNFYGFVPSCVFKFMVEDSHHDMASNN